MTTTTTRFQSPPRNMVQEVKNIVEGYGMGPLRALAQDPVQNAYDARRPNVVGPVYVDYRLHERVMDTGEVMSLLTVTDRNTTGLQGAPLSIEQLERRGQETGYQLLQPDENWAAWEAMGYTKQGVDSLGSRGQGKAAFLYHSLHDSGLRGSGNHPLERMIILYDTFLQDGAYRLGFRFANPTDRIFSPPYEGDQARDLIESTLMDWPGSPIPLKLEPLTETGTRIIVPFLSQEAVESIMNGDLVRWLERCWWRAVQKGELVITVGHEDETAAEVAVPRWWADEPWVRQPAAPNSLLKQDVRLEKRTQRIIKRIVLTYEPDLKSDEIENAGPQYSGVQILRRNQWVETLGASEKYGDFIPAAMRAGFRGFVELDLRVERELRDEESPQHDRFNRHKMFVRQIDSQIRNAVREFAEQQGWLQEESEGPAPDVAVEQILDEVTNLFVSDIPTRGRRRRPPVMWECRLDVGFPREESARVDWGESLTDIVAFCSHDPNNERRDIRLTLFVTSPDGQRTEIGSVGRMTTAGTAVAEFGNMTLVRTGRRPGQINCEQPGRYRLTVEVINDGSIAASASRYFYVKTDPPARQTRPVSVGVAVSNATADRVRVNHGDEINIGITVSNRTSINLEANVDASIESLLLANLVKVELRGRPDGDVPFSTMLTYSNILVVTEEPEEPPGGLYVVLAPGRHFVRADVRDQSGSVLASGVKVIYVEIDPEVGDAARPFVVQAHEDVGIPYPIWNLEPPGPEEGRWVLWFARHHPTYEAALAVDRLGGSAKSLRGIRNFWQETFCAALVEWALFLYRDRGDEGRFRLLVDPLAESGNIIWDRYAAQVQELLNSLDDPLRCSELQREVVSLMLYILPLGAS